MAFDLQKLTSEYVAVERMDRALQREDSVDETDLIGLRARVMRRREILRELTAWIRVTEDLLKSR
jgi:aminoglycoside N3'-acetyltransferase